MNTKNLTLSLAAALLALACSTRPSPTTPLTGQYLGDGKVPDRVEIEGPAIDTVIKTDAATRSFKAVLPTDLLSFVTVWFGDGNTRIILDGTPLKIVVDGEEATVTSSRPRKSVQAAYNAYDKWMKDLTDRFEADAQVIADDVNCTAEEREKRRNDLLWEAYAKINGQCRETIRKNRDNALGLLALTSLSTDDEEMLRLIEGMGDNVREMEGVKEMTRAVTVRLESAEGKMFRDFEVVQDPEDPAGSTVRLSDFVGKGKYVLVDFWASWCGPCRAEIPNLKSIYDEFHGDRFDMLSIAVWDRPEASKAAAEELGVSWNRIVNAQQETTALYGIESIPHVILFGPDGTILKRGLRGDQIREAVAEALK